MAKNIYGVQKVKEPEVRDGLDVAGSTAAAAAQAAQMGAQYGPWVAAGAGIVGGAYAFSQQKKMQREEQRNFDKAEDRNKFVDSLENRAFREDTMVSAQAKYGMKPNKRYEEAEIEGDGSGSANGIGEIHVDKDYNIKNVARGAEKHEDGGFKINNLEKKDIIFPTQNNEQEFNRVLNLINRWKLKRDPRAKQALDKKVERLPTDEDYGYARNGGQYDDGRGQAYGKSKSKEFARKREAFEKRFPGLDYDKFIKDNEKEITEYTKKGKSFEEFADEMLSNSNQGETVDQMQRRVQERRVQENRPTTQEEKFEKINYNGQMIDNDFKLNDVATDLSPYNTMTSLDKLNEDAQEESQRKASLKKQYEDAIEENKTNPYVTEEEERKLALKKQYEDAMKNAPQTFEKIDIEPKKQQYDFRSADEALPQEITRDEEANAKTDALFKKYKDEADRLNTPERKAREKKEREEAEAQKTWDEITKMEEYNNPGKYASMINKSIQGSKPIEGVERRYLNSNKYKYEDMSAKDRQANVEQRNYQNLSMRGKGLTAGQIQSYGAQNNAQFYGNAEGINARENQKRYEIANANVDLTNKDSQTNLSLDNQYDAIERQQRAVQQKYKDSSYSDLAKLSQLDEQKKYMMNKDRKNFLRDKATLPYLGTKDMKIGKSGIYYIKDEDGNFVEAADV